MTTEIDPIHDQLVFQFLEDTTKGKFNERTAQGVLVVEKADKQLEHSRWVKVLATGPKVSEDISVGDIVLVKNLRWTNMFQLTDTPYWITAESEVLAIWDDPENPPKEVA